MICPICDIDLGEDWDPLDHLEVCQSIALGKRVKKLEEELGAAKLAVKTAQLQKELILRTLHNTKAAYCGVACIRYPLHENKKDEHQKFCLEVSDYIMGMAAAPDDPRTHRYKMALEYIAQGGRQNPMDVAQGALEAKAEPCGLAHHECKCCHIINHCCSRHCCCFYKPGHSKLSVKAGKECVGGCVCYLSGKACNWGYIPASGARQCSECGCVSQSVP